MKENLKISYHAFKQITIATSKLNMPPKIITQALCKKQRLSDI